VTQETVTVLKRGLTKHCPHCGKGELFENWNTFQRACPYCGCEFERRGGDTWFFTYMSTAFLAGVFLLWMFLFPMTNYILGNIILVVGWFLLIVLTIPYRKGLAIAIDYLIDTQHEDVQP